MKQKPVDTEAIRKALRIYLGIIVRGWRYTVPITISVAIGSTLIFYIPPLIIAELIGRSPAARELTLQSALPYVLLFGIAWMAGELLWRLAIFLMIQFESSVIHRLYTTSLDTLLQKDIGFFNDRFSGAITKNVLAYGRRFEAFFDTIVFEVISQLFPAVFAAIVLAFISPWLSLTLIGMMALGGFLVVPLVRKRMRLVKAREDAHAAMSGHISDVVSNIAAIKSYGSEVSEQSKHNDHIDDFVIKAKRSWHYQNNPIDMVISPIYVATNVLGLVVVLSLEVDATSKASLFIAFNYFANVTRFLWSFNSVYRRLEEAVAEASLYVSYTLEPSKVVDAQDAARLRTTQGKIVFNSVDFTHGSNNDPLFNDLSLVIEAGQKVGLVGHSGAGKSTIANLLLRYMDIDTGSILIDGQDISQVTQRSLHRSIAYVPQEPLLFHRSLRDNIAYADEQASDSEIEAAASKANATDFIDTLPLKYQTLVGERGVKLSGGQRQRVAIARAILKDAPILLLDEATSALDSESEKLIQASLDELMKGRTSLVIAHRLSTIAKLDRIIVLQDGKIVEDGTHQELLKLGCIYANLWAHQSGGFLED